MMPEPTAPYVHVWLSTLGGCRSLTVWQRRGERWACLSHPLHTETWADLLAMADGDVTPVAPVWPLVANEPGM